MADTVRTQTLIDTNKRALIKVVIVSDATATANASIIKFANLANALNATSHVSATNPQAHYEVGVKRVYGGGKLAGSITLKWEDNDTVGNANTEMLTIGGGNFDISLPGVTGDVGIIRPWASGENANCKGILYNSTGNSSGDRTTLFIDLRKSGADYDQGQAADPAAFNYGNWGIQ